MGNAAIIQQLEGANNCPSAKKFDAEDVIKPHYLYPMFQKFKGETGVYVDDSISLNLLFDDIGKQQSSDDETNWRKNIVEELNELYTAGLCNPEFYEEKLKDSSKYQVWKFPLAVAQC